MDSQTVLIPVEFPDPDPLPSTFVDTFTSCKVLLLGVYELPPDVDSDERQRREVEAYDTLYTLANQFVQGGETADVELMMGENVSDAPTTVAEDRDVDALLVPNPITTLGRVLVPLREAKFMEPVTDLVSTLDEDVLLHTTLFHAADDEDDAETGREMLSTVRDHLVDEGFPRTRIDTEVVVSDDPPFAIGQAARDYELLIMGETQESSYERVFGKTYESIAERTNRPILVVRE
jgi:nucleotide-binding universal stress UspA family protein